MTPDELKARGLRVKPLSFMKSLDGDGGPIWTCRQYAIRVYTSGKYGVEPMLGFFPTLEAAKAAAEADHAARIAAQVDALQMDIASAR